MSLAGGLGGQLTVVNAATDPGCANCAACANCGPWAACLGVSDQATVENNGVFPTLARRPHPPSSELTRCGRRCRRCRRRRRRIFLRFLTALICADCYMHLERDATPCNDGDDSNNRAGVGTSDQCYQGSCGSWQRVDTVINTEAERLQWAQAAGLPAVGQDCFECSGQLPYYLALTGSGGHGAGSSVGVFNSYMAWRYPNMQFSAWSTTIDPAGNMGPLPGQGLILSKNYACGMATANQWGDAGAGGHSSVGGDCTDADNVLHIRSEDNPAN